MNKKEQYLRALIKEQIQKILKEDIDDLIKSNDSNFHNMRYGTSTLPVGDYLEGDNLKKVIYNIWEIIKELNEKIKLLEKKN